MHKTHYFYSNYRFHFYSSYRLKFISKLIKALIILPLTLQILFLQGCSHDFDRKLGSTDKKTEKHQKHKSTQKRIALLLPLKGPHAEPAKTIKDGFYAASNHIQDKETFTIKVYDTATNPEQVYEKAIAENDIVVGPLTKPEVKKVATIPSRVPVLALNTINEESNVQGSFYQFGLIPEDEVYAAVIHAKKQGLKRAFVLVPEGAWGTRLLNAFTQYFEATGGEILKVQTFSPKQDLEKSITALLKPSKNSATRNTSAAGNNTIATIPADMIFMSGTPEVARKIKTLLNQHKASQIPVYATSAVYSGKLAPEKDKELNGVTFCDMPWIISHDQNIQALKQTTSKEWPTSFSYSQRYFALGMDAYRLAFDLASDTPLSVSKGVTGTLVVDKQQHIQRQLSCATFAKGIPEPSVLTSKP